jgi:arsenite methyltransferase
VGWGVDDPILILGLVAAGMVGILAGFMLGYYGRGLGTEAVQGALISGAAVGLCLIGLALALYFNSSVTKFRQALVVVRNIPFGGDETILDVGCGRGAFSVLVAQEVRSGLVIGVDVWNPWHVTGNSPQSLLANADRKGVRKVVSPVKSVGISLPFPDSRFDIVASCLGLQHVGNAAEFDAAITQMVRVLREGGRLAVLTSGYGRRLKELLPRLGMTEIQVSRIRVGVIPIAQRLTARKSFRKGP